MAVSREMAKAIVDGDGPLNRIERFCREHDVVDFADLMLKLDEHDPDLARWVERPGKGVGARLRGVNGRISKVLNERKQEARNKG